MQVCWAKQKVQLLDCAFGRRTITPEEWLLLYALARRPRCQRILEIGIWQNTSSTAFLAAMERRAGCELVSCDIKIHRPLFCHPRADVDRRWQRIEQSSHDLLPTLTGPFDLILVDGDHGFRGVTAGPIADLRDSLRLVSDTGVIAFHDINGGKLGPMFLRQFSEIERKRIRYYPGNLAAARKGFMLYQKPA